MPHCDLYDDAGALIWSLSDYGGVMPDVLIVPAHSPGSYSYPDLIGHTLFLQQIPAVQTITSGQSVNYGAVSYPSGVPTVTFPDSDVALACYLWAY